MRATTLKSIFSVLAVPFNIATHMSDLKSLLGRVISSPGKMESGLEVPKAIIPRKIALIAPTLAVSWLVVV